MGNEGNHQGNNKLSPGLILRLAMLEDERGLTVIDSGEYPPETLIDIAKQANEPDSAEKCLTEQEIKDFCECFMPTAQAVLAAVHLVACEGCMKYYELTAPECRARMAADAKSITDKVMRRIRSGG